MLFKAVVAKPGLAMRTLERQVVLKPAFAAELAHVRIKSCHDLLTGKSCFERGPPLTTTVQKTIGAIANLFLENFTVLVVSAAIVLVVSE